MISEQIRFEIKAKNNRLYEMIHANHKTLSDFCDLEGFPYGTVCAFLNLSETPYKNGIHRLGQMSHQALRLCEIFGVDPLFLFPPELYAKDKKTKWIFTKTIRQLTIEQDSRPKIEYMPEVNEYPEIKKVFDTLNKREVFVLKEIYGFDGGGNKTYGQVGKKLRVCRERVRQIEAKAFRKIRHPSRRKFLVNIL